MKSYKKRIEEGRCKGVGADYVPFITSREARSIGTSSSIYDPVEDRIIHTLSTGETWLYYMLRWNPEVVRIREQFLLDEDKIKKIAKDLGIPAGSYYTTDFLVDYKDGTQKAFSVKSNKCEFDLNNAKYQGYEDKFFSLVQRQKLEKLYWESQGIPFNIVTKEDINLNYVLNISDVMSCYQEFRVVSTVCHPAN